MGDSFTDKKKQEWLAQKEAELGRKLTPGSKPKPGRPVDHEGWRYIGEDVFKTTTLWACPICGAVVDDRKAHKEWHESLAKAEVGEPEGQDPSPPTQYP